MESVMHQRDVRGIEPATTQRKRSLISPSLTVKKEADLLDAIECAFKASHAR